MTRRIVVLFIIVGCFLMIFQSQSYRAKTKVEIRDDVKSELNQLGETALASKDVPVGAVLIYKDTIIGRGYNTVKKENNIGGHAEINAMSDAYKTYGEEFSKLDRAELFLYSTFEPCEMCKGAIIHYNIKNVYFERNKTLWEQLKSTGKSFFYNLKARRFDAEDLQENLFRKHPDY